tara:strand:+ start:2294 stop:6442 length:4149 start_codon:yes stop_codon:yes gene_type:complete
MVDKKVKETINYLNLKYLKKLILKNEETINQTYNMDTFKDLYEFLQLYKENNIITWLKEPWVGKDKQESLLRLFAGLGLIDKIKSYDICKGNYNEKTITKNTTIKDVFYNQEDNLINLKDKGDSSDLTGIFEKNEKHLLVTTSKNLNKTQVGKLDIDKILTNFKQYQDEQYTMSLCVCVRDRIDFETMKNNVEKTNHQLKSLLEKEDTIIIDWNDLNQAYHQFKIFYRENPIDNFINSNKTTLCLKMHQHLGVLKTLRMKNSEKKKILWGHIQRSGKSYIIGGCIIQDSIDKDECNYLIITTAPNETIEQQRKVFDCIQLTGFNIIVLNGKNKKPDLTKKNIIICSKQFLQTKIDKGHDKTKHSKEKTKSISWLKKMSFDIRFIDESHNGGTTELAKKTLEFYGKQAFTVQITATYSKPINDYNIPKDCWILWDLEDIKLCKNITNEGSIIRLVQKHGDCIQNIISKYSQDSIISEYSKYPELWLLTDEINPDVVSEIINDTQDNNYGWSPDACFLLKQAIKKDKETHKSKVVIKEEFQNEGENLKLWYRVFGKKNKFGIPDKDYPDDIVFMKRIEKICKDPTIDSRFIGEGDFHNEPMIIMAFLPQNNIDKISKATIKLLERNNVIPDYEIISINSKITNNPKQSIEDARIKARNSGKKGVLVLSGKQCSLGVSIDNCDIVLLLNNSMGFDMIYQMMFRCMTEGRNKKCGFVVDLNIHRVIETSVINYASLIKPDIHPRDATKFILQERLINLNGDHWMSSFGNNDSKITALCENVYELYSSNTENALNHFLNRLRFKEILLTKEEQKIFKAMFSNTTPTKKQKELIDKLLEEDEEKEKIKKGIEKTKVDNEGMDTSSETSNEDEKEEKQINYMDILKHIIPLICLLTIHDKETSFVEMFELIEKSEYVYNILIDQTKSWWGKSIDSKIIKKFINVYMKYMKDDKETNQIIRTVKELFMKNIKNNRELSILIDKYLIPQELEKKSNAEVSTPFKLRKEMLDKIPVEFWTSIKKVFEPCSGKGGFIVDIIDRFMIGLKDMIPDEKQRYKTIVEECLYFSDINPTNIFICKLLIDPYNEYKLNYNEGNTLELDIKEKWDIDGFDAVIGNPPYNSSGDTGTGNTIWQDFTKVSLNKLLKKNGFLLYVHPPGWRKPNTKKGKFYGLYKLMTQENQMLYLSIHGIKDGQKTFNCGTRYDWYVIQNKSNYTTTIVNDEKNNNIVIDMNNFDWLPNYNIDTIQSILAKENEEKCPIIYNRSNYGSDKKYTQKDKTNEFKYPIIHTIPKTGIRYIYSNCNDKGHFGISKVIFGQSNCENPYIDMTGKYGMSEHSMAIKVSSSEESKNIEKCLKSENFNNKVLNSCLWSNFMIDWRLFTYFKKDFWKEFI